MSFLNFGDAFTHLLNAIANFTGRIGKVLFQYAQLDREQRDSLIHVVVKLSRDPRSLLFVGF